VATQETNTHPFPAQDPERIAFHICPECSDDIASGTDANGNPTLCRNCDALRKIRSARLRILPARQQPRISGRRKRL
jgi:hypothetical protein